MKKFRPKYHCTSCQESFSSVMDLREHPCVITQHIKSIKMVLVSMEYIFEEEFNSIKIVEQ